MAHSIRLLDTHAARKDSQRFQCLAGHLAVCFCSGQVDKDTAKAIRDLFPGAALVSLSVLAGGQMLVTADMVQKPGYLRLSFAHLAKAAGGEAVAYSNICHALYQPGQHCHYTDVAHAATAYGCTSLTCAPIAGIVESLSASPQPVGVLSLGLPGDQAQAPLPGLVQALAELANALAPYMARYCATMAATATPSIFLEAAEADLALCGGGRGAAAVPGSYTVDVDGAASDCSDMSDDEWWREELLASSDPPASRAQAAPKPIMQPLALPANCSGRSASLVLLPPALRQQPLACKDSLDAAAAQLCATMQRLMREGGTGVNGSVPEGTALPPQLDRRAGDRRGFGCT